MATAGDGKGRQVIVGGIERADHGFLCQRRDALPQGEQHPLASGLPERNSLEYCVSCLAESKARFGAKLPMSSSFICMAFVISPSIRFPRESSMRCPSVWPRGTAFTAAITWFSSQAHR